MADPDPVKKHPETTLLGKVLGQALDPAAGVKEEQDFCRRGKHQCISPSQICHTSVTYFFRFLVDCLHVGPEDVLEALAGLYVLVGVVPVESEPSLLEDGGHVFDVVERGHGEVLENGAAVVAVAEEDGTLLGPGVLRSEKVK